MISSRRRLARSAERVLGAFGLVEPRDFKTIQPLLSLDDSDSGSLQRAAVQDVLEDFVRPALQQDGGDIELVRIEDNDIYVRLVGACSGCPSSTATLHGGVERLLREEFPSMGDLIQIGEYEMPS